MAKLIEITGKAISGEWGNDDESGNGIPVLRTTNFTNTGIIDFSNVVTRDIKKKNISDKFLRKGDIIIEKSGGSDIQPVGRVVYFEAEENKYLFNNFTGLLRVTDNSICYSKYLFYSLFYNYYRGGTVKFQNKTTGLHNLKIDDYINNVEISLPTIETQHQIAENLDKVKHLIDLCNTILEKLDLIVKARFVEMFGEPITNNKKLPILPMTKLCEIIDGDRGKNYPKTDEFLDNGYCLFLNAKNVTSNGFNFDNCMFITKEKDTILRKGKLVRGDVVLTTRGTIGNLAFYTNDVLYENVRINSGMVILRMNHLLVDDVFFIEQFKLQLDDIKEKIASGSAQPQLPISTMNKINVIVPKISCQKEFANFVRQIDKSKLAVKKVLEKAETLKKALMQKYFK